MDNNNKDSELNDEFINKNIKMISELYEDENMRLYKLKEFMVWHRLTPFSQMPAKP